MSVRMKDRVNRSLRGNAQETVRHQRVPQKTVEEKAKIADRCEVIEMLIGTRSPERMGMAKDKDQEVLLAEEILPKAERQKTGRSPSGKDERPRCFACKNGACTRGRDCDY